MSPLYLPTEMASAVCRTQLTHPQASDGSRVSPVIQRLQRIPLTLKDEGTAELQMMLAVGEIDQSMLPPGSPTWSLSEKSLAEYESVWTCIWNLFPTSTLSPRMRS